MPNISVVVPVHDEADHIPEFIPRMADEVEIAAGPQELLVVENGSTDDSAVQAESVCNLLRERGWEARVVRLPEADYGAAMRRGLEEASGQWIVTFDIDYFSGEFVRDATALDADVVIASKRAPGSSDQRSRFRRLATAAFNLILRHVLGSSVSDTHGIKAFRRSAIAPLIAETKSNQDLFDTELILRAERNGARIAELPVVVEEQRAARSLLKRVPRTLRGVWRLRAIFAAERDQAEARRR